MQFLKRIFNVITTALVAVVAVVAIALVGVRLLGFEVYTVLSGSMEPTYHVGSVIWVDRCDAEEVVVGDPITFVLNEDLVVVTHRVIDIDSEVGCFYTQGDANDAPDASPVLFENLIGVPVFTVPHLGYFVNYIQNPPGLYIAIIISAAVMILLFIPDLFGKDEEDDLRREQRRAAKKAKTQQRYGRHGQAASAAASTPQSQKAQTTPTRQSPNATARSANVAAVSKKAPRHAHPAHQQTNNPRLRTQSQIASSIDNQENRKK